MNRELVPFQNPMECPKCGSMLSNPKLKNDMAPPTLMSKESQVAGHTPKEIEYLNWDCLCGWCVWSGTKEQMVKEAEVVK